MRLTIELPPELERELSAEATQLGLPLPEYALRLLAIGRQPGSLPRSGQELLLYWHLLQMTTRINAAHQNAGRRAFPKLRL